MLAVVAVVVGIMVGAAAAAAWLRFSSSSATARAVAERERILVEADREAETLRREAQIEAREGVSTGVSAVDRVTTIRAAIAPTAQADDIVSPGHVFPLRAQPGGVLTRRGHTEGSVDLAVLAGLRPAGVLCELMNADGTMMRGAALERYAAEHGLVALTIAELADHLQKQKDGQAESIDDEVLEMAATV